MWKILVLGCRDWSERRAGDVEHYACEVFRRIAESGHLVIWVCYGTARGRIGRVFVSDNMQVMCLGPRILYRPAVGMLLSRLARSGKLSTQYDVMVDCVAGKPLPLGDTDDIPVLPMVFELGRGVCPSEDPPGPLVAATDSARRTLLSRGVPDELVVYAPAGTNNEDASWDRTARRVLSTIERVVSCTNNC